MDHIASLRLDFVGGIIQLSARQNQAHSAVKSTKHTLES